MDSSPDWRFTHTSAGAIPATTSFAKPSISYTSNTDSKSHALPPLAHIDITKIRREGHDSHESPKHISPISTTGTAISGLNSPSGGYLGPPPPYSSLMTTPSNIVMSGGHVGPPSQPPSIVSEPRRVEDERRVSQSLPSIHEALGKDSGSFHRPSLPTSALPPPPSSMAAPSPTTPISNHPSNPFSSQQSNPYELHRPPRPAEPPARPVGDASQKDARTENMRRFPFDNQPIPRSSSPRSTMRQPSQSQPSTPSFFNSFSQQPFSHVQQPQSHTPSYPPAYSYPPPSSYPNQPQPSSIWRPDPPRSDYGRPDDDKRGSSSFYGGQRSPGPYPHGESVKRHLETFDLELALNELLEGSSRTQDFARKYVDKSHHMHRSGIATALPSLGECDELYNLQRSILNSVDRIRDIVVTQQHALAEQRSREEAHKLKQSTFGGQFNDPLDKSEGEGGFAGSDPKKRRGRHAPPGRCHSCARSETPEWRRGPDGARTLCNACGLHYAKLTRKLGPKAALPGSSLRPKEDGAHSP